MRNGVMRSIDMDSPVTAIDLFPIQNDLIVAGDQAIQRINLETRNKDWEFTNGQNLLVSEDGKRKYKCISEAIEDVPDGAVFFVHFSHIYSN